MVIRTIHNSYRVIRTVFCGKDMRAYLCAGEGSPGSRKAGKKPDTAARYLIMKPENPGFYQALLLFFFKLSDSGSVERFEECFVREGVIWTVFRHYEGLPLAQAVTEELPYEERFALGRELTEQLFAERLPVYLQYEAAKRSDIVTDKSFGLRVNFRLTEPERLSEELFPDVLRRYEEAMELIYAPELQAAFPEELSAFFRRLSETAFSDGTDVYRAFRSMDASLRRAYADGAPGEEGLLTRMWNWLRGKAGVCFHILYGLVVAGLLALLAYVCVTPAAAPADRNLLYSIGELTIIEAGSAEAGEPEEETQRTETTQEEASETRTTEETD